MIVGSPKTLLTFIFLSCLLVTAAAQEPAPSPPAKRKYKHADKIETTFDKAKNLTTVRLGRMNIWTNAAYTNIVDLTLFFTYQGQVVTTPRSIAVGILARTSDGHFSHKRELSIKADKYVFNFGQMELLQDTAFPGGNSQVLASSIPYEIFLRIANAKKLDIKLADAKYLITDDQLEAIRDLASRTVP